MTKQDALNALLGVAARTAANAADAGAKAAVSVAKNGAKYAKVAASNAQAAIQGAIQANPNAVVTAGKQDNTSLAHSNIGAGSVYDLYIKRALDIGVGVAALPFVGALLVVAGPLIYLEDRGPIFYNAPRMGKNGKEFKMYKLRSMKVNAPDLVMEDGSTYNGEDDPRLTNIGRILRKTSMDEMPQFLNVLKGDMSVIGPRPDLRRESELYEGREGEKLRVRPGITGYAAVYGRNAIPWHDRLALDVYYVDNMSFALDAKVFFKTFATIFKQEGVFVEENEESRAGRSQ